MTAPKRPSRRRRSISGWLSPMGTALRIWAWTLGEEALVGGVTDSDHVLRNSCFKAEGEEEGEVLEGRRLILWVGEVGWVGVEVGFLT